MEPERTRFLTSAIAKAIRPTDEGLIVEAVGTSVLVAWVCCSTKLAAATETERFQAELSPGGYGVNWPLIDEDISIGGLLQAAASAPR